MKATGLLITCCLAAVAASAQPAARPANPVAGTAGHRTQVGLKAGFSRADLQSSSGQLLQSPAADYLPAFSAGAYGQRELTHVAAVRVEALYARTGFRGYNGGTNGTGPTTTNRFDYLAVPLLLVGRLGETFSFHLGPQAAVLLAARNGTQRLGLGRSGFQRLDAGAALGAEAQLGVARLGVRSVYSLLVLNPSGAAVTDAGQPVQVLAAGNDYHNLVLQAYLGFDLASR